MGNIAQKVGERQNIAQGLAVIDYQAKIGLSYFSS